MLKAYQLLVDRQLLLNKTKNSTPISSQLADAAISAMLIWSQDKYADLYGPLTTERYLAGYASAVGNTDLRFDIVDGKRIVTEVPSDSAAEIAGVQVGDSLLGIDEFDISQSVGGYEIATLLRGPVNSTYKLTVQRGDQILELIVTRKPWNYLSHQIIHSNIGYLKTEYFFADQPEEMVSTIFEEFSQIPIQALIWDLRNNSGGSPTVAEKILSYFREPGTLLYTVEFKDGTRRDFKASGNASFSAIPIVIIINEETWSAGEIAAAAMVQRASTILIGKTTAGKGVVQDTVSLDETHMLHFTVAKWLTPTGEWIQEKGVHPQLSIEDNPITKQDEVMEAAINYLDNLLIQNEEMVKPN